jgi:hypothetical protein
MLEIDPDALDAYELAEAIEHMLISLGTLTLDKETIAFVRLVIGECERFPELAATFHEIAIVQTSKAMADWLEGQCKRGRLKLKDPIDILFIDADKPGYADYLKKLLPLVRPGGLILAHNTTNTGRQMPDYFTAVTTDPNLDSIFLGQHSVGIGITLKKRRAK